MITPILNGLGFGAVVSMVFFMATGDIEYTKLMAAVAVASGIVNLAREMTRESRHE